jgi:hypothetical protein
LKTVFSETRMPRPRRFLENYCYGRIIATVKVEAW